MTKFERHMEDLEAYCKEFGCDKRDAMMDILEPLGVMVYFKDMEHSCVAMRGVAEQTSKTNSVAVRGVFTDPKVKKEGLSMNNLPLDSIFFVERK